MSSISDNYNICCALNASVCGVLFFYFWALANNLTSRYLSACPAPPLKLIDLPGIDQRVVDDSTVSTFCNALSLLINYSGFWKVWVLGRITDGLIL